MQSNNRPKTTKAAVSTTKRTFEILEEERQAREEEFLMQLWYALNPFGDREKIEGRVLYVFLKLAYDPFWDGQQESMDELIEATTAFLDDVQALQTQREFESELEDEGEHDEEASEICRPRQRRPVPARE